jgi:hypothetical protein
VLAAFHHIQACRPLVSLSVPINQVGHYGIPLDEQIYCIMTNTPNDTGQLNTNGMFCNIVSVNPLPAQETGFVPSAFFSIT